MITNNKNVVTLLGDSILFLENLMKKETYSQKRFFFEVQYIEVSAINNSHIV